MQITPGMMQDLRRPFEPHEHEFLNGAAYIREDAITTRIEDVYPEWELTILDMRYRQTFGSDVQVTITVRLTIGGVSRDGVGSAKVIGKTTAWSNNKKTPLPPEDHSEVNEAEKSAATDALKRAARLFGIGRYLLSLPDTVKDEASLAKYLNGNTPQTPPKQAATARNFNDAGNAGATNGTHHQNAPEAFSDGEIRNVQLTAVTVEKSAAGQPRMRFTTNDGMAGIFGYTRKPFIEGGWCNERDWLEQDTYTLPTACPAKVVYHAHQDGGGYWTIASVESFQPDFLQSTVVNHDATPAATPSHIDDPLRSELLEITHVEPRMATGRTLVKQWIGHAKFEDEHGSTHPIQILLFAEDRRQLEENGYDVSGWDASSEGQRYPNGITVTTYKDTVGRKLATAWNPVTNESVAIERAR